MTEREALKLALEALSNRNAPPKTIYEALHAIKEALAQQEQEPVAWAIGSHIESDYVFTKETPLYTTPPQRTWVGLTDIDYAGLPLEQVGLVRWAEAKLKEKNHG